MTRDEYRNACIEAMCSAYVMSVGVNGNTCLYKDMTAAFDTLDPFAVVRRRNGLERWHDELTNPPETKL
jgi:hypothetical protein